MSVWQFVQDQVLGMRWLNTLILSLIHIFDLGNSTDIVANDAASTLAKFANITTMDQSQFGNLGATLVDLGNNFATVESDIMNMSLRLAAAGHQRCV